MQLLLFNSRVSHFLEKLNCTITTARVKMVRHWCSFGTDLINQKPVYLVSKLYHSVYTYTKTFFQCVRNMFSTNVCVKFKASMFHNFTAQILFISESRWSVVWRKCCDKNWYRDQRKVKPIRESFTVSNFIINCSINHLQSKRYIGTEMLNFSLRTSMWYNLNCVFLNVKKMESIYVILFGIRNH